MPGLDQASLRLEPVAREQASLDVDEVAVADRDGAAQPATGLMEPLRKLLDIVA